MISVCPQCLSLDPCTHSRITMPPELWARWHAFIIAHKRAYRFRISTGSDEAQEEGGGMMLPRFVHKVYAKAMGYFWLPCPVCGRMFGGHEARSSEGKMLRMVCSDPFCVYTARTKPQTCDPK